MEKICKHLGRTPHKIWSHWNQPIWVTQSVTSANNNNDDDSRTTQWASDSCSIPFLRKGKQKNLYMEELQSQQISLFHQDNEIKRFIDHTRKKIPEKMSGFICKYSAWQIFVWLSTMTEVVIWPPLSYPHPIPTDNSTRRSGLQNHLHKGLTPTINA